MKGSSCLVSDVYSVRKRFSGGGTLAASRHETSVRMVSQILSERTVSRSTQTASPRVQAVIPARGGSKGIPRKNARLLHGKPLIEYAIDAALGAERIDAVCVSTDDPEIRAIAERRGVRVIARPECLAGPDTTLDEVVVHAVDCLERSGQTSEIIITIQPTCPLISSQTIDRAIEDMFREAWETCLSVVSDVHLNWTRDSSGLPLPRYTARLNRQFLPPNFRETGAIIACQRRVLEQGSRIGQRVGIVEISKTEAIDIDDYFDWWLAEKSMRRKRICLHVVGNTTFGLGHVYRALTLADRLIDHELVFLVSEDSMLAAEIIRNRFYPVEVCDSGAELSAILASRPDLVINDVLNTDANFVKSLQAAGASVINFEDEGLGSDYADLVINAVYGPHPRRERGVYFGEGYCCLRDEFYTVQSKPIEEPPQSILLLFGGTDSKGVTLRLFRWLDDMPGDWKITVIAGIGFQYLEALHDLAGDARHEVEVVVDTKVVSRYMADADIAVTSAGRTVFELASLGVPMLVVSQNARERDHIFARESAGTVYLGDAEGLEKTKVQSNLRELISSRLLREKMRSALLAAHLRKGIEKVLVMIQDQLVTTNRTSR